ncbi:hypothetical protein [Silvibacterium acidisoli]|uniref:hypothetical protein n=1 Tax=Acidobacteriaceae bacterium ZG23-2 TaxID=2883246 RepID=UPI00406BFA36
MKFTARFTGRFPNAFAPRCYHCMRTLRLQEQISSGYCDIDCKVEAMLNQSDPVMARAADAQHVPQGKAACHQHLPLTGRVAQALSTPAWHLPFRF